VFIKRLISRTKRDLSELEDIDLVKLYQRNDDPELISILFDRYAHLLYGLCLKYLGNPEDARDVVMELFEQCIAGLRAEEIRNVKAYLSTIARNNCLMRLRHEKVHKKYQDFSVKNMESDSDDHLDRGEIDENRKMIHRAIEELPEAQKTCIKLFYFHDMSYKEIVKNTGFELKKVKSYIQNGKRRLKSDLEKHIE
jgi:RNA polymerase sigma-70 factor (ECF subfamily)